MTAARSILVPPVLDDEEIRHFLRVDRVCIEGAARAARSLTVLAKFDADGLLCLQADAPCIGVFFTLGY